VAVLEPASDDEVYCLVGDGIHQQLLRSANLRVVTRTVVQDILAIP
jgi:hypothetical protein